MTTQVGQVCDSSWSLVPPPQQWHAAHTLYSHSICNSQIQSPEVSGVIFIPPDCWEVSRDNPGVCALLVSCPADSIPSRNSATCKEQLNNCDTYWSHKHKLTSQCKMHFYKDISRTTLEEWQHIFHNNLRVREGWKQSPAVYSACHLLQRARKRRSWITAGIPSHCG